MSAAATPFIADYSSPGSQLWQNTLLFKDFTEGSIDVRLRIRIESQNVLLETKPSYITPPPITLSAGVPYQITATDLADYLIYNNLNVSGISLQDLQQNGKLPEGFYTFSIQALEYTSGKAISLASQRGTYIQLKDQPLILQPTCGNAIIPQTGQNIIFQWQNSGPVSPDPLNQNEYKLTIFEITHDDADPMAALNNQQIFQIFETSWSTQTTYAYTISDPILDLGKRYLYYITARDNRGTSSFKNDGRSEICWFYYGYPENASIDLDRPKDKFKFSKRDRLNFKWSGLSNSASGQQTVYTFQIVELNKDEDPKAAFQNKTPIVEESSFQVAATQGFEWQLDSLARGKDFAWRVLATSGQQQVGSSEIRVFSSTPLIEEIQAGPQKIVVKALDNQDLNNLKGEGLIIIPKGSDTLEVDFTFSDIKAKKVGGRYVLDDGEILFSPGFDTLRLSAAKDNLPNGYFDVSQLRVDKNGLSIKGVAKIPLTVAVNSPQQAYLTSAEEWVNFNSYTLKGGVKPSDQNTFELLDPYQFEISYENTGDILLSDNVYTLKLDGKLRLHKEVKTEDDQAVYVAFYDQDNFTYFDISNITNTHIGPLNGTKIRWEITEGIIDLDETKSPAAKAENEWMGFYVKTAELVIPTDFDESNQIYLTSEFKTDASQTSAARTAGFVDGTGLNLGFN